MKLSTLLLSLGLTATGLGMAEAAHAWSFEKANPNSLPSDAGFFGIQDNISFVCGVNYRNEWNAGEVYRGQCQYTYGGMVYSSSNFYILRGNQIQWFPYNSQAAPPNNAIYVGSATSNRSYACGVLFRGEYNVGKIYRNQCHIAWGGQVFKFDQYLLASSSF